MVRTSDDPSSVLSLDEIFDVLVSPRRRAVLYELHGCSEPMVLTDLATAVSSVEDAAVVDDTPEIPEEGSMGRREKIAVTLDHVHLPKLQQAGLVEYDRTEKTVKLKRVPRQFERYLRFAAEDEQRSQAIDATV